MKIFEADGKQEMYGRSGFKTFIFDDHQLFAKPKMEPDDSGLDDIKEYSKSNFEKVADYDRKLSPYDRTDLLVLRLQIKNVFVTSLKHFKGFQFGWLKIKRIDATFLISIILFSNHPK